jgi:uncharacterized Zn finger protein (UPF0148 family)
MTQCIGVKREGSLCQNVATRGSDYCPAHDPARAEARSRSASKAARSKKPHRELSDIKEQVLELVAAIQTKEIDRQDAAICGQLYNVVLRAITVDLKVTEFEDFERRIEELEQVLDEQSRNPGGSRPW